MAKQPVLIHWEPNNPEKVKIALRAKAVLSMLVFVIRPERNCDMHEATKTWFLAAFAIAMAVVLTASAEDWPQWLGPQRDSVWRETGILEAFPADGPRLRWRTPIGSGYSGPAVADGRVFVMDRIKTGADPARAELLNKADSPINANFKRRLIPAR